MLTDGMTPFDVLSSVFGSTLAPSELEDALATNGYDFDHAMAWLVDRALPIVPPQTPQIRLQQMGGRVTLVSRDRGGGPARAGYHDVGARGAIPRYVNGRPVTGGNRVCRYFVAGECLRADCRFRYWRSPCSSSILITHAYGLLAMTLNVRFVASGYAVLVQNRRAANFYIICLKMWMFRA